MEQKIPTLTLRPMKTEETDSVFALIDALGWTLTFEKFKAVSRTKGYTIYVAISEDGSLIGTCSTIATVPGECLLGNLVVASRYHGLGLGKKIMDQFQKENASKILTMSTISSVTGFYRKCGFHEVEPSLQIFFMQVDVKDVDGKLRHGDDVTVKTYTSDMMGALCDYVNDARGYDMSPYMSVTVQSSTAVFAAFRGDKPAGFVSAFQKHGTVVVDGMVADDDAIALLLYRHVLEAFPDKTYLRFQTPPTRTYLTTVGTVLESKSFTYFRFANGKVTLPSYSKLYAANDCDYAI